MSENRKAKARGLRRDAARAARLGQLVGRVQESYNSFLRNLVRDAVRAALAASVASTLACSPSEPSSRTPSGLGGWGTGGLVGVGLGGQGGLGGVSGLAGPGGFGAVGGFGWGGLGWAGFGGVGGFGLGGLGWSGFGGGVGGFGGGVGGFGGTGGLPPCVIFVQCGGPPLGSCGPSCPSCTMAVCGRRPQGLSPAQIGADSAVGDYLARSAHLEAASVPAFEVLERELLHHAAPVELVEQAQAAAADEVRHAALTSSAALRYGGHLEPPSVRTAAVRSLEAIALENAVEGCARETYGALVAGYQAQAAQDPAIAAMMRGIAEDETRHASLAWQLAAWLEPKLGAEAQRTVAQARSEALAELELQAQQSHDPSLLSTLGLPEPGAARALLETLLSRMPRLQPAPLVAA